jgi:hypothetical protein
MFISILYMFRARCAHHQENLLYECGTWCLSPCVDDRLVYKVPDGHQNRVTNTRSRNDTVNFPDNDHIAPETYREWKKHTKRICAPRWILYKKMNNIFEIIWKGIFLIKIHVLSWNLSGKFR